jgi:hypothetical protein
MVTERRRIWCQVPCHRQSEVGRTTTMKLPSEEVGEEEGADDQEEGRR